jgi:hypothetical protein
MNLGHRSICWEASHSISQTGRSGLLRNHRQALQGTAKEHARAWLFEFEEELPLQIFQLLQTLTLLTKWRVLELSDKQAYRHHCGTFKAWW